DHVAVGPLGVSPARGNIAGAHGGLFEPECLVPVESPLEFLDEAPYFGALGAGEAPSASGAAGREVFVPGAQVLGEDDLLPFADKEEPIERVVWAGLGDHVVPASRDRCVAEHLDAGPLRFRVL